VLTRIFSPVVVPGLCGTIGRQLNVSKRLKQVSNRSNYRFEHIVTNSSGKVVTKYDATARRCALGCQATRNSASEVNVQGTA